MCACGADLDAHASKHASGCPRGPQRFAMVNHPAHYGGASNKYECICLIEDWGLGFSAGSALKYIVRAGKKSTNIGEDLAKALWYLERWFASTLVENYVEHPTLDPVEAAHAHELPEELRNAVCAICLGRPARAAVYVREYLRSIGLA